LIEPQFGRRTFYLCEGQTMSFLVKVTSPNARKPNRHKRRVDGSGMATGEESIKMNVTGT
jgi:hypothetical protein